MLKYREGDMKKYQFINPTYYVASNIFHWYMQFFQYILGRLNKISESNQLMRLQPWVPGIENRQEKSKYIQWEIWANVIWLCSYVRN